MNGKIYKTIKHFYKPTIDYCLYFVDSILLQLRLVYLRLAKILFVFLFNACCIFFSSLRLRANFMVKKIRKEFVLFGLYISFKSDQLHTLFIVSELQLIGELPSVGIHTRIFATPIMYGFSRAKFMHPAVYTASIIGWKVLFVARLAVSIIALLAHLTCQLAAIECFTAATL